MARFAHRSRRTGFLAALLVVSAATAQTDEAQPLGDLDIAREGGNRHRAAIDAMELAPVPAEAIDGLTWTSEQPSTEALADRPVLFLTWASWHRRTHEAVQQASELVRAHADDGLVVVAVHHQAKADDAEAVLAGLGVTSVLLAVDADGAFRKAMRYNGDPEFYVVDRAGNLRFADITADAVADAVSIVCSESVEEAARAPQRRAEARDAAKLAVPQLVDEAAYANANWPAHNAGRITARDMQGKPLPAKLGNEQYVTDEPATEHKVIVLDFWATWCGPCVRASPILSGLQKEHAEDVAIIGISDEPRNKVAPFVKQHNPSYAVASDQNRTIEGPLQVKGIPHAVIVSTDGVIRWQGNPLSHEFPDALKAVIEADPGVQARRRAEAPA